MTAKRLSHVVGIDDAPFARAHRGDVLVVGAVFAGERFEGVLTSHVRRDGRNATDAIARMCLRSRFAPQFQLLMLQGIAVAGFNVIDIAGLSERLGLPVLVVVRRRPDLGAIRTALMTRVPGGERKWRLIERAGLMEPLASVWVQRAGLEREQAAEVIRRLARHSRLPEPLRTAHLIAGGLIQGESRPRP
jgi:endonuclease V-like protein UPF0215 family